MPVEAVKYEEPQPEKTGWTENIFPIMRGYKLACCDCGLVHDLNFDVIEITRFNADETFRGKVRKGKKWRIAMRVRRNNRATGQVRRKRRK